MILPKSSSISRQQWTQRRARRLIWILRMLILQKPKAPRQKPSSRWPSTTSSKTRNKVKQSAWLWASSIKSSATTPQLLASASKRIRLQARCRRLKSSSEGRLKSQIFPTILDNYLVLLCKEVEEDSFTVRCVLRYLHRCRRLVSCLHVRLQEPDFKDRNSVV